MAESGARQGMRRFIPRRVRWAARVCYRLVTGWYIRSAVRQMYTLNHTVAVQGSQIEAQSEMMDFFLRRLQRVEQETTSLNEPPSELRSEVSSLKHPLSA